MSDVEAVELGQVHAIVRGEEVVGIVAAAPGHEGEVHGDLTHGDQRVQAMAAGEQAGEPVYELGGECEVEKPRTCELEITLGVIQEDAAAAGVSSAEIDALEERPFTESEAKAAAEAVAARLPAGSEQRADADEIIQACWGEDDG